MNSLLASSINGGFNKEQVACGSSNSILSESIEFIVTEKMTNYSSSQQGKNLIKLTDTEDVLHNGQNRIKKYDQNKNKVDDHLIVNGNDVDKSSEDTIPVPKVQLFTGKIHAEWYQAYKIGAGLNNLGNTCFMNTVIQCLTYCPPLANYLLHDNDHTSKCTITGFCMMCILQRHIKRVIGKTGEVFKPMDIYNRLKLIAKHFQFGRQEDAHEFLRYVIDHLWKSCLIQVNGVKLDSASKETTVINKIFGGYHRSQVTCMKCKKKSNTFDHFMDFILDIKQNVTSLEKALEKFIQPELLQQENCYKCPKCKMKVEAQKRFTVYQAPVVATFQLKRFDYNRSFGGKITKPISYPEKLNLRPYMSEGKGDAVMYHLNAVLVHSGPSCNTGHYYCYVKNANGYWYIMDDSRVHQVSVNQVLNQSAYVLFYIKVDNNERASQKKCIDSKSSFMKGTGANSHFCKVEVNNGMKPEPLSNDVSPFSNSKPHSPNGVKKFNSLSSPNRDKISFAFRNSAPSTQLSSPKSKSSLSSESVSVKQSGLVPYVEDSSESSDASESYSSQNKSNSFTNISVKHLSKTASLDSYKSSPPPLTKLKKPVLCTSSYSSVNNTSHTVSATDSWIVTDAPETPMSSSSSSTGVNSTTDWHVIEASDLALNNSSTLKENNAKESLSLLKETKSNSVKEPISSLKESKNNTKESLGSLKESKNSTIKEYLGSPKLSTAEISPFRHSENGNKSCHATTSGVKMSNGHENNFSSDNCNFRKQIPKSKISFPEDEETSNSFKRKYCDSNSKTLKDSHNSEHSESKCSPLSKKVKYTENSPFSNVDSEIRNSGSKSKDNDSCTVQHKPYTSNCDNSRTSLVNGVSFSADKNLVSPSKNFNSSLENNTSNHDKVRSISKGNQDTHSFEYTKRFSHEMGKLPHSNKRDDVGLFGTTVPTWREENHYRPSYNSGYEVRRSFDDYDNELDRGKVRKSKMKNHYNQYHQGNHFQKYSNEQRYNKYGKHYNSHHNFSKYPQNSWKSNNRNRNRNNGYHQQNSRFYPPRFR